MKQFSDLRFAGDGPHGRGFFMEPALLAAGLGTLGLVDAVEDDNGSALGVNALMTALPVAGAVSGALALGSRSPRMGRYIDNRVAEKLGSNRYQMQSPEVRQQGMDDLTLEVRLQKLLRPDLNEQQIRDQIDLEMAERLKSIMGVSAWGGAALGALGMMTHDQQP